MSKECEAIQEKLSALIAKELSVQDEGEVRSHVRGCSLCRVVLEILEADDRKLTAMAKSYEKTVARVEAMVIGELATCSQEKPESYWRVIIQNRMTKFATTAVILIGVGLGFIFMNGPQTGGVAWGEVAKTVEQIQSYIFRGHLTMSGLPGAKSTMEMVTYISESQGMRMETYIDGKPSIISCVIPKAKTMITIMPEMKKYMWVILTEELQEKMELKNQDPRLMVEQFLSDDYMPLGRDVIDGIEVEGIEVRDPYALEEMLGVENYTGRLWVSVETELPVRFEMEWDMENPAGGKMNHQSMVMDGFEWNADLEASGFFPDIPEDYELMAEVEMPDINSDSAVKGLAAFARLTEGRYPSKLNLLTLAKELNKASPKNSKEEEPGGNPSKQLLKQMIDIQMVGHFYRQLAQEGKDPVYYGESVTAEDVDAVLMLWRESEEGYRVIFGDLRMVTVTGE